MTLERLSDPEISYLAIELSREYQIVVEGVQRDIMEIIEGLYEVDTETYLYCRRLLENWMYTIADMQEYQEPEEEQYRPMGYRGSWMEEDNNIPEDD